MPLLDARRYALDGRGRIDVSRLQRKLDAAVNMREHWHRGYLSFPSDLPNDRAKYEKHVYEYTWVWIDWMAKEGWRMVGKPIFSTPFDARNDDGTMALGEKAIFIKAPFVWEGVVRMTRSEIDPEIVSRPEEEE